MRHTRDRSPMRRLAISIRRVAPAVVTATVLLMGLVVSAEPAAASTCGPVRTSDGTQVGANPGYYVCEYGPPLLVTWPDGRRQYFVVGTNYAVWDAVELQPYSGHWSYWGTEGGVARSTVHIWSPATWNSLT